MIISHGREYIFVHIPKTGGTSLALALEERAMKDDILIGDTPKALRRRGRVKQMTAAGRLWKHSRLRDIYGLIDQDQAERYFVFTIVRNPWDRMVSFYHWLRDQSFDHPHVKLAKAMDFSGFLNDPTVQGALRLDTSATYVSDPGGTDRCDLYLRIEALEAGMAELEERLNLRLPRLAHANRSQRGAYQVYYSDADAALINRIFAEDIERFGYRFEEGA